MSLYLTTPEVVKDCPEMLWIPVQEIGAVSAYAWQVKKYYMISLYGDVLFNDSQDSNRVLLKMLYILLQCNTFYILQV